LTSADLPVTLREITADTLSAVLALEVAPEQRRFVAANAGEVVLEFDLSHRGSAARVASAACCR
jgi:hypothetical protein